MTEKEKMLDNVKKIRSELEEILNKPKNLKTKNKKDYSKADYIDKMLNNPQKIKK